MAMSKGCTIALIIVGILVVIAAGIVIYIWLNFDDLKNAGIDMMVDGISEEVLANLPEGYSEEYATQLMTELKAKLKDGSMLPEEIQEMGNELRAAMADEQLDADESERLLKMIEEKLGKESPVLEEEVIDSLTAEPAGA